MTGTTPPAPIIAKARAQEFQSTLTSAELRVSTRSVGLGHCVILRVRVRVIRVRVRVRGGDTSYDFTLHFL